MTDNKLVTNTKKIFKKSIGILINELRIILRNSNNLLKIKTSIQISYHKLKKLQKFGMFMYVIISIYRGIFFRYFFTPFLLVYNTTTSSKRVYKNATARYESTSKTLL